MYILSTGSGKSLGLYKTLPKEEEIQDGEAFLLILFFFVMFLFERSVRMAEKCVPLCVQ